MKKIGEILIDKGYINRKELESALLEQKKSHIKLGEIFIEKKVITDDVLVDVLSEQYKVPVKKLAEMKVSDNLKSIFMPSYMKKNRFIPVELENKTLFIATDNPGNFELITDLEFITGLSVSFYLTTTRELDRCFLDVFGNDNVMTDFSENIFEIDIEKHSLIDDDAEKEDLFTKPVVRLVNAILFDAIKIKASDIHFEPTETNMIVRYRIDGFLHEHAKLPKKVERMLVSRIKIMAKMDITVSRKPQDGNIQLYTSGKDIALRISTLPTMFGEKVVRRILDKSKIEVKLEQLGIDERLVEIIKRNAKKSQGMFLVTGPTGSGKTTTLYSVIQELDRAHLNISTIEDPIEYTLKGINQTQTEAKGGIGFPEALRTLLRQDPNVILLGEIRDGETASIAFKAAMTGHLLFSTLHTNDELSTIIRLRDLGVDNYLIADAMLLIAAQRLVRKLCTECRVEYTPDEREKMLFEGEFEGTLFKSSEKGCDKCNYTGYSGVIGIYGILEIDSSLRALIERNADANEMELHLRKIGYKNVFADGMGKVQNGITSIFEVERVLDTNRFIENAGRKKSGDMRIEKKGDEKIVLIVDDVPTIRVMLKAILEMNGYITIESENGIDALNKLERNDVDLIISDIEMPEMNGFKLLEHIRENEKFQKIPFILLTSLDSDKSEIEGLKYGADDYITKPIDPDRVLLRMQNILKRS